MPPRRRKAAARQSCGGFLRHLLAHQPTSSFILYVLRKLSHPSNI